MALVSRPRAAPGGYLSATQWALWFLQTYTSRADWKMRRPGVYPAEGSATVRISGMQRINRRALRFSVLIDVWVGEGEGMLAQAEDACAEAWQAIISAPDHLEDVLFARSISGPQIISDPIDPAGLRWQASAIVTVQT